MADPPSVCISYPRARRESIPTMTGTSHRLENRRPVGDRLLSNPLCPHTEERTAG
jgi:hypothetical protein